MSRRLGWLLAVLLLAAAAYFLLSPRPQMTPRTALLLGSAPGLVPAAEVGLPPGEHARVLVRLLLPTERSPADARLLAAGLSMAALVALVPALVRLAGAGAPLVLALIAFASPLLAQSQVLTADPIALLLGAGGLSLWVFNGRRRAVADLAALLLIGLAGAAEPLGAPAWLVTGGLLLRPAVAVLRGLLATVLLLPSLVLAAPLWEAAFAPDPMAPLHFRAPILEALGRLLADPAHGVLVAAPWLVLLAILANRGGLSGGNRRGVLARACLLGAVAQLAFLATSSQAIDPSLPGPGRMLNAAVLAAVGLSAVLRRPAGKRPAVWVAGLLAAAWGTAYALVALLMAEPRLAQPPTWSLAGNQVARLIERGIVHRPRWHDGWRTEPRRLWVAPSFRRGWHAEEMWGPNPARWTRLIAEEERAPSADPVAIEYHVLHPRGAEVTLRDAATGAELHRKRHRGPALVEFELPPAEEGLRLRWEVSRPMPPVEGDDRILGIAVIRPGRPLP